MAGRVRARRRDVDRVGARAAGDCRSGRETAAAGPAAADSGRAIVFLLVTLTLSAGVLTNLTFKSHWGRPRPVLVTQFNGDLPFVPWWDPRGECGRNCSFFSGEGATAFWTFAPAALTPPAWRPLAYAAATLFGVATSVLRMAFGGHFFTDVAAAGLVTFLVIWLAHGYDLPLAVAPGCRMRLDAALTEWPGPASFGQPGAGASRTDPFA